MKVLVIGQGGREHAIVKALALSPRLDRMFVCPGNDGMRDMAVMVEIDLRNSAAVEAWVKKNPVDLVVIGPEQPLVDGLADTFRRLNIPVFGPGAPAAKLEGSKIFTKDFLKRHKIPTAESVNVNSVDQTLKSASGFKPPYVLKADGLAAGKGVFICKDETELKVAADKIFTEKIFGNAGEQAMLEQFYSGYELSALVLVSDGKYCILPMAQDHKRLSDGDLGPNTGGMGTVAPMPVSEELLTQIRTKLVEPTVTGLHSDGISYRGVLFIGVMVTDRGPLVLEFNVRFGDPETQVILPLLDGDWLNVFLNVAKGQLQPLEFKKMATACVVLAAEGYPEKSKAGTEIIGDLHYQSSSSYFLHAGTKKNDTKWIVNGGRVINAVGIGSDMKEALKNAYDQASKIRWQGVQMRKDIGAKA